MRKIRRDRPNITTAEEIEAMPGKVCQGARKGSPVYDNVRFPHIAEVLCREYGMTHEQLSNIFGVAKRTVDQWVYLYPDFKKAVVAGRDAFDGVKVENALLKRALGYKYDETTIRTVKVLAKHKYEDFEIMVPARETSVTTKELPADVKAIMFWLTNRQAERWKMVTTVNANISANTTHTKRTVAVTADLNKMGIEQLKALRDMVASQGPKDEVLEIEGGAEHQPMIELLDQAENLVANQS